MVGYSICHRCAGHIPDENYQDILVVCPHCGWILNSDAQTHLRKAEKKSIIKVCVFAFGLILLLAHVTTWDKFSVKIVPLWIQHKAGMATVADLHEIIQICQELERLPCLIETQESINKLEPDQPDGWASLGKHYYQAGRYKNADQAYTQYLDLKGKSPEVFYEIAKNHQALGNPLEARRFYELTLKEKPKVLQITVVRNYVDMLMKEGDLQKARSVIKRAQKMGSNTRAFMVYELDQINKQLERGA